MCCQIHTKYFLMCIYKFQNECSDRFNKIIKNFDRITWLGPPEKCILLWLNKSSSESIARIFVKLHPRSYNNFQAFPSLDLCSGHAQGLVLNKGLYIHQGLYLPIQINIQAFVSKLSVLWGRLPVKLSLLFSVWSKWFRSRMTTSLTWHFVTIFSILTESGNFSCSDSSRKHWVQTWTIFVYIYTKDLCLQYAFDT